jgi:peptidoglycan hydrolase FlgJ
MKISSTPPSQTIDPAIRKAAQGFEAVFLREMIGSMRKAQLAEGMFQSSATDQFRELADARTADAIAAKGGFGIAAMVEHSLTQKGSKT